MIEPQQIRGLFLEKRFRKYDRYYFLNGKRNDYNLLDDQYFSPIQPEIRPTYNPFEKAIFYDTKRHYDIYSDPFEMSGAMLMKERWYDYIANEYRLDKHVAFKGIKREFEGEIINDLVFVYFYSDKKTVENLKN